MNNKKTGQFIAALRKELGYSQKDLAEKLNITDKAVSKWETGRSAPDVSMLLPLSEVLGVSVTEILKGERICEEEIHTASNEMIVKTLKKSKSKVMIAAISVLVVLIGLICSYPAYHYFSTISEKDSEEVREQAILYSENEEIECIAITQNSDKIAYLFADDEIVPECSSAKEEKYICYPPQSALLRKFRIDSNAEYERIFQGWLN